MIVKIEEGARSRCGVIGSRLYMGDGSVWLHPYSGAKPIQERVKTPNE